MTTRTATPSPVQRHRTNEKKIWRFLTAIPDHNPGEYVCVQELEGDFGEPNVDGHDEDGWRFADQPAATRVVFMERKSDGSLKNVHGGGYNGNRYTQRDL